MDPAAPRQQNLLIVPCLGDTPGEDPGEVRSCYLIYVVPLSHIGTSASPQLTPKFVVDCCVSGFELCVVGSRIYMFNSDSKPDSAVGAFHLSQHLNNDDIILLRDNMMCGMAPMRDQKRRLRAIPTHGGKILAFSTRIESSQWDINSKVVDFELYDPQTDSWQEIPSIYQAWSVPPRSFAISAYTFVDDVTFVVQTDFGEQFRLTLGAHGGHWEQHCWLGGEVPLCGYSRAPVFGGGGDQLWLTPFLVFDIKTLGGGKGRDVVFQFPISAFQFRNAFHCGPRSQSIVFEETSSCCLLLETAQHGLSGGHHIQIDVYHLDLVKYFQEKAGLKAMVGQGNRVCAPQLEHRLVSSTLFSLSPKTTLSLPVMAKPPTTIQI